MALPLNYRWIVVGKLSIRNRKNAPDYAPDFNVSDLMGAMADRIARNDIHRSYNNDSRLMWCSRMGEEEDYHKILIEVGDKNISGFSLLNFGTLQTRDIEKDEEEGSHYSAHILIGKTSDQYGRYLILIEKVPGISISSIKSHMTWACNNQLYEKEVEDEDGNKRWFRPFFEIDGHQSKTIRDALRTGVLQDIEFMSHEENHGDGLDEDPIVSEEVYEARWSIKKRVTEDQALTVFEKAGNFIRDFQRGEEVPKVFVRIKSENGQIRRTEVEHNGNEILEQAFIQNEIVSDFERPLTQRYEVLRDDMVIKMIEIANNLGD